MGVGVGVGVRVHPYVCTRARMHMGRRVGGPGSFHAINGGVNTSGCNLVSRSAFRDSRKFQRGTQPRTHSALPTLRRGMTNHSYTHRPACWSFHAPRTFFCCIHNGKRKIASRTSTDLENPRNNAWAIAYSLAAHKPLKNLGQRAWHPDLPAGARTTPRRSGDWLSNPFAQRHPTRGALSCMLLP